MAIYYKGERIDSGVSQDQLLAAIAGHTHTAADVGAAASGHIHTDAADGPWLPKSGGTVTGKVYLNEIGGRLYLKPMNHSVSFQDTNRNPSLIAFNDGVAFCLGKPDSYAAIFAANPTSACHVATKSYVDSQIPFEGTFEPVGGSLNLDAEIDDQYFYEYQIGCFGIALGSFNLASFPGAQVGQYVRGSVQFNNIYASETYNDLEGFVFFRTPEGYCYTGNLACSGGDDFTFEICVRSTGAKNDGGHLFIIAFGNYK